jgi:hypothetical protein
VYKRLLSHSLGQSQNELLLILLLATTSVLAVEIEHFPKLSKQLTAEQTKTVADKILKYISQQNYDKAFSILVHYSIMTKDEIIEIGNQTAQQYPDALVKLGKIVSVNHIKTSEVKDHFLEHVFIIKHEKSITRWEFLFYNNGSNWFIHSFYWDANINKLFSPNKQNNTHFLNPSQIDSLLQKMP